MGTNNGFSLAVGPSDEQFNELREHIQKLDVEKAERQQDLGLRLGWLLETIESNPNAIRKALGFSPAPKGCVICELDPCGCERRNDR